MRRVMPLPKQNAGDAPPKDGGKPKAKGRAKGPPPDVVGVEIGAGLSQGAPAVRLRRAPDGALRIAAAGFVPVVSDIESILAKHEGIVILDEAYSEYARQTMVDKVDEFDNLIVCKTFSKAYAMANLRVGYCATNLKVADMLNSVKVPYSLNSVSEGAAIAALKDQDFVKRSVDMVAEQRPKLFAKLKELGFEPYPSDSNFILAKSPIDHVKMIEGLKKRNVLIRDFGSKRRTENCVRMTIGTEELNKIMTDAIEDVRNGKVAGLGPASGDGGGGAAPRPPVP